MSKRVDEQQKQQVAKGSHPPDVSITELRVHNSSLIRLRPKTTSVSPLSWPLLLFASIGLICCDTSPNQSSSTFQGASLQSNRLWRPTSGDSEISFEHRNLKSIPSIAQMCIPPLPESRPIVSSINVASFAHNHIKEIKPAAFSCLAENLKILILRHNEIEHISDKAFNNLESVQVLLLDNNLLRKVPSKAALSPLKALRHLNLANNRIEWLDESAFGSGSANLISLNLKGNPLSRLNANSLAQLNRLNTLTLSHSALSGHLVPLNGLTELRFYYLDRAANLSSISLDLCADSRKLSSLVLKSNQLEQIPKFAHCHSLLLLDLSYNKIAGSLNDEHFAHHWNLIDLYLGHNQLESIAERAFAGLKQLQVLELSNNHLKWIHPKAFLPIQATISELDLSNNHQLMTLSSLGLENLASLKVYGNQQLKELPYFRSANSLALTYAYHCCDYLKVEHLDSENQMSHESEPIASSIATSSLVGQFIASISAKFGLLLSGDNLPSRIEHKSDLSSPNDSDITNLSEIIVWPAEYYRDSAATQQHDIAHHLANRQAWPEVDHNGSSKHKLRMQNLTTLFDKPVPISAERDQHQRLRRDLGEKWRLIDELVWQLEQCREAHLVFATSRNHGIAMSRRQVKTGSPSVQPGFKSSEEVDDFNFEEVLASEKHTRRILPSKNEIDEAKLSEQVAALLQRPNFGRSKRQLPTIGSHNRQQALPASRHCLPKPNAFLPCQDLFDTWWLRAGIWAVFLLAFGGNILVIVVLGSVRQSSSTSALTSIMWLAHSKRHIDVPRFLVINLAIADLLMAFYLGILAMVDLSTLGRFKAFAIKWQFSTGCKMAGFLGVLSSELSVFILAVITLERNYAITNAVHLNRRLSLQKAMIIMFIGYALALGMAIMPLNGISDYRKFSICLPLDMDSSLSSQLYIITLIGINTISFVLLLSCYLRMYCAIRGSQAWNTNDLRIAKRMSILVFTDFICWVPIIIVGFSSLFGHYLVGSNGIKILTIFVLPLNSVANPFLYAITTKKFKRDLETLFRRARSLAPFNCTKANKDPKIFFGYNQYQHELMMNKKKNKFNNLMDKNGNSSCRRAGNARTRSMAARNQANCTANRVTINRTTCSCGAQRYDDVANQPNKFTIASSNGLVNHQSEQHSNATIRHLQPRIVLDSVDGLDKAVSTSIKKSRSTNCALNNGNNETITCTGEAGRCHLTCVLPHHLGEDIIMAHPNDYEKHERYCCCLQGHQNYATHRGLVGSSRPKSADTELGLVSCGALGTNPNNRIAHQTIRLVAERDSSTTSSHLVTANRGHLNQSGPKYLSVFNAGDRSASACGYLVSSKPTGQVSVGRPANTINNFGMATGSYDTVHRTSQITGEETRSTERLSLSITKLLFEPLAKAWSSIQISLSSSLTQVTASQNLLAPKRSTPRRDHCNDVSSRKANVDGLLMQADNNIDSSTTIDDLLLHGDPSSGRLLRLTERRMSRSCDVITRVAQRNLSTASNSSTSGNEQLTSQDEYDDDRRILLATIHRITESRKGMRPVEQEQDQYSRARCTRCRSWSPALLGKLEECIYQLKSRIPRMGSSKATQHAAHHEATIPNNSSENRSNQHSDTDDICHDAVDYPGIDCNEDSEDTFNERGLVEWNQRRQNMLKRHHFQRNSIKSSTYSDTLSTRTGGTILTNMSVSFDSSTSIPVVCQQSEASDAVNSISANTVGSHC